MLNLDFDYGMEIINEIFIQKHEKELRKLYYYAVPNGINQKYETYAEFKKSHLEEESSTGTSSELTVEEIMDKTKDTLDLFAEEVL